MIVLDGKVVAQIETEKLKQKVQTLKQKPSFLIIQVGNNPESNKYIKNKINKAIEIGLNANCIKYEDTILEKELINNIKLHKEKYDGVIVQLPLPDHINKQNVLDVIEIEKDIDGLSSMNMNNFYNDIQPFNIPATARAVKLLLDHYNINLHQKIMIIGESNLVGKPTKKLLSNNAKQIESRNKGTGIVGSNDFDILVVAVGSPCLIKSKDVKEGCVIIDVGINVINDNKIVGDVDFEDVKNKVSAISPVPGGVGPLTVICLLKNLVDRF